MPTEKLNWEQDDPEWELIATISGTQNNGTSVRRGKTVYEYVYNERLDVAIGDQIQYRVCAQIGNNSKLKCDRTITVVIP